jgi:prepilin-type N-terminal cleavage/methylation domain-containing protein
MRSRGFSLVEVLVALLLLAVVLGGMLSLWSFGFNATRHSQRIAVGYNIGRRQVERVRAIGFAFMPEGPQCGGFTSLGDPTDGRPQYVAALEMYTLPDSAGEINARCLRRLKVTVTEYATGEQVFDTDTYLTQGGL